jgi:hypothetical protein
MVSTRQERERLVLNLYNQGKNTREISQEARMKRAKRTEKLSQAAQAYKLFSDGKLHRIS